MLTRRLHCTLLRIYLIMGSCTPININVINWKINLRINNYNYPIQYTQIEFSVFNYCQMKRNTYNLQWLNYIIKLIAICGWMVWITNKTRTGFLNRKIVDRTGNQINQYCCEVFIIRCTDIELIRAKGRSCSPCTSLEALRFNWALLFHLSQLRKGTIWSGLI